MLLAQLPHFIPTENAAFIVVDQHSVWQRVLTGDTDTAAYLVCTASAPVFATSYKMTFL